MSVRDLMQSFAIPPWEIEQAAELRWLRIVTRRPSGRGRPSRVAELRDERNAKLPKPRRQIEPEISTRHWLFAMRAAKKCCPGGMESFRLQHPRHRDGIHRNLPAQEPPGRGRAHPDWMRRPHVKAAMQWFYAQMAREIARDEPMPETVSGIRARLAELGCWRARLL